MWYKIDNVNYKIFIFHILKYTDKNILLLKRIESKLHIEKFFIKKL